MKQTLQVATLPRRLGAFIIDFGLIAMIQGGSFLYLLSVGLVNKMGMSSLFIVTGIAVSLLLGKDSVGGASLGKRKMKLSVFREDCTDVGWSHLFLRNITYVVWPIDFLCFFIRKDKRRLGDVIAGTNVFDSRRAREWGPSHPRQ